MIDSISFVNPTNDDKPCGREIDRLQAFDQRVEEWQRVCKSRGYRENYPFRSFRRVLPGEPTACTTPAETGQPEVDVT